MIVDSSALMSIVLGEPDAELYLGIMSRAEVLLIAAPTYVEAVTAAERRGGAEAASDMEALMADLEIDVVGFDEELTRLAIGALQRFGKGRHQAALNLGDAFSYALAQGAGEPLLFKGQDFAHTDVASVLFSSVK